METVHQSGDSEGSGSGINKRQSSLNNWRAKKQRLAQSASSISSTDAAVRRNLSSDAQSSIVQPGLVTTSTALEGQQQSDCTFLSVCYCGCLQVRLQVGHFLQGLPLPPPPVSPWSSGSNCDFTSGHPSSADDCLDLKLLTGYPTSKPLSTFQVLLCLQPLTQREDLPRYGAREVIR
ncbi:envelope glycoprotein, partial [Striga asiatica]